MTPGAIPRWAYPPLHALMGMRNRMIAVLGGRTVGVRMAAWREGRVCLIRHTYGDRSAWMLPGGAVDWREEPLAAAMREAAEEVGLTEIARVRLVHAYRHPLQGGEDVVLVYAGLTAQEASPASPEIAECRWVDPQALPEPMAERVRRSVEAAVPD